MKLNITALNGLLYSHRVTTITKAYTLKGNWCRHPAILNFYLFLGN